jgi:hypothetical protein
MIEDELRDLD